MEVFRRSSDDPPIATAGNSSYDGVASDDDGPFFDLEFSIPLELNMSSSSMAMDFRPSISTSSTDEISFNGHLFSLESSPSPLCSPAPSEPISKLHFPASMLKSATKFRVFMFRFSSNNSSSSVAASLKFNKGERKLCKDVILRYIGKIKPLYVRVSNMRFSVPSRDNKGRSAGHGTEIKKQSKRKSSSSRSSFPYSLKAVPARLRKSRSVSSAVSYVCSLPRRDDSLLQHEDGIQNAIAHCKRSFHSDKGSPLIRSMSDPGEKKVYRQ